jgi:hypothetical protein
MKIYMENVVSKPPTYRIYIIANNYKIHGYTTLDASTGANSVKALKRGKYTIEYNDGTIHELHFPIVHIKGITFGTRIFNYKRVCVVTDVEEGIAAYVKFNPDEKGAFASIFSSKQKTFPDTIKGNIVDYNQIKFAKDFKHSLTKDAKSYCTIDGEWADILKFDDKVYWKREDYKLIPMKEMNYVLPSDSAKREDLNELLVDNEDGAQVWKEKLEGVQRGDRKLREDYSKKK